MDVLERVPDIHEHDAPVSDVQLNTARQALLREIAHEGRTASHRRRWVGVTALVGGAAVTAIAVNVFAPARVDPAAAAVLLEAAAVTIEATDTTLAPGQYLRIETSSDSLMRWDVDMGDDPSARFNNADRADAEAGVVIRDTRVLYVPADRSEDWIWDWSADDVAVEMYGDRSDQALQDWEAANAEGDSGYWPDLQRLPGGETEAAEGDTNVYLLDSYREFYDEMPREPQALLDWFRAHSGDPDVPDQWVVDAIGDVLSGNLMPAELRAASLRALALIPGIQVAGVDGSSTTLKYTSGDWLSSRVTELTLDTEQGIIESITQSTTSNLRGSEVLPDTIPDSRTTVITEVVDHAPQP